MATKGDAKPVKAKCASAAKPVAKKKASPKPLGRPSSYSQKVATEICARLADGESLRSICMDSRMPDKTTVFRWLAQTDGEVSAFRNQYARAREAQADRLAEEILEIADDGRNDTYVDEEGNAKTDHDVIARSRLRVDSRKWLASKLAPKKYGERVAQEISGPDGGPQQHESKVTLSAEEAYRRLIDGK